MACLAEFGSVVDAVECAVLLQREMAERNQGVSGERRIDVRMGVHVGDVIIEGEDRHGDAVNIAARLQQLAEPGGICVSGTVVGHVRHKVALRFESRGEERLKNISEPVKVYRVTLDLAPAVTRWRHRKAVMRMAAALLILLVAAAVLAYANWPAGKSNLPPTAATASGDAAQTSAVAPSDQGAMLPPAEPANPQANSPPDQGIPILVVLPFQDLTAGQAAESSIDLDKLGKGIAEEFGTDLATFPDFEVISSSSAFAYAGMPIPEIVKLTGATFVVEGSLRKTGDKVMVTLQVIRGSTDRHLKIVQLEENLADPVVMQRSIAAELRDELGGMTGIFRHEYEKMAWEKADADLTEYDYYIRGHSYQLRGDSWRALKIWKSGLARFPDSVLLHCKLSFAYFNSSSRKEAIALVDKAATMKRRSALDEWYYHWAAAISFDARGDHNRAASEARAAIEMAPYDTVSHSDLSWVMGYAGQKDVAIEWATFAVTHDPEPLEWYFDNLQIAYQNTDRWPEAIALAEAQVVRDPVHAKWWYEFLATAYFGTGQLDKGREADKKAAALPSPPQWEPPR